MWILWTMFGIGVAVLVLEFGRLIGEAKVYSIIISYIDQPTGEKLVQELAKAYGEKTIEFKILHLFILTYSQMFERGKN